MVIGVLSSTYEYFAISTAQNAPLPLNAYVEGCVNPPCVLPKGQEVVVHLVFRAPRTTTKMTTLAQAFLLFFPINYPLNDHADTCSFLTNSFCPVRANDVVQYTLRMMIENLPVNVAPSVEIRIEDDSNRPVTCIRVPIVIAPPLKP
ncbi:hypothetical protein ABMA28_008937 [Loxostege sticticalis]|uniref:MD-2-related lipid-recognition domain-containing protein n=1 Tax=Loxostege sticticalis TaxID=481309 RepID=A0ABD0SF66_LOXSC